MGLALEKKNLFSSRSDRVKCVDFHPAEPWVLVSLYSGHVNIWNYRTQSLVKSIEVSDLPVRAARFIARKNWIVTGSDDLTIRVFNYHTLERVASFDGHSDYIRKLAVHPSRPLVLSASDDMSVKLWDWEKGWKCVQTFEGHQHYVMDVAFNPKDGNTFATASLDRTIKVWSLASPKANYTLEGHDKGVNSIAYYPGPDRPYLVSGSDDHSVRVWDYQNKSCIRVMAGHTQNVSSVMFHPELPLILSGSEDCTLKVWNVNTFRLEASYSMSLDRIWSLAASPVETSDLAIGCDDGIIVLQLGKGEPTASMDANGKAIFAKHHEILTSNVRTVPDLAELPDGSKLMIASKEFGQCEIFPQSLQHSPNGRFVAVCGDGEYIIYTAVACRNRAFGKGLDFCWSASSNEYAVKDSLNRIALFSAFAEAGSIKLAGSCERIFGGNLLAVVCTGAQLCLYDWQTSQLVRRIDVEATGIYWCEITSRLAICTQESVYLLQYRPEVLRTALAQGIPIPEDGIEQAFEVLDEINEPAISALWVNGCFIFVNGHGRLSYHVLGSQTAQLAIPEKSLFLLGYLPEESRLILTDKDLNLVVYNLSMAVIAYESALLAGDAARAASLLPEIPADQRNRFAHLLDSQGRLDEAFKLTSEPEFRFDLAVRLGRLDVAYDLVASGESASDHKWRMLGDRALADWKFSLAEKCFWRGNDLTSLLLLYTASANASGLERLAKAALEAGESNIAFTCYFSTGRKNECYELLKSTGEHVEAALFARTYLPAKVDEAVGFWKEQLCSQAGAPAINKQVASALARPSANPELFAISRQTTAEEEKPSAPLPIPSGMSSATRPRNVSFDESSMHDSTFQSQLGSFGGVPSGSIGGGPVSVTTTTSDHMSLEVNTAGTASHLHDMDEIASMRTFPSAATAGQLDLDRLTIHDELPEDQMLTDPEDDVRNPKPSAELFFGDPAPAQSFTQSPPVPPFSFKSETVEDAKTDQIKAGDDEAEEEEENGKKTPTSPLQNISLPQEDDDWL